ncbi:hypothetical protein EV360DRAFT_85137 [Lentinula raphanica]|nr:hypothetical protein EV360DRAFT_85137 [Lentinula raphanica]
MPSVTYGGGPIASSVGEALIAQGVPLNIGYGGTEFGVVSELRFDQLESWEYTEFNASLNIRWVPQGDVTFEAQFLDVLTMLSYILMETVPALIENTISADPLVAGAVVFGRQRDQPGIIVEPSLVHSVDVTDEAEISKFRNAIWPIVKEANRVSPAFSKIYKEMILVVKPGKPLPRVGKGTVAKKAAMALYEAEINEIYDAVEMNSGRDSIQPPASWNAADLETWSVDEVSDILFSDPPSVKAADLFKSGMDCPPLTILRLRLVSALRKSGLTALASTINQNIVYGYPTISQLSEAIVSMISNPDDQTKKNTHEDLIDSEMISKYSGGLDEPLPQPSYPIDPEKQVVLLTGSTGNIGAQLLANLLSNDSVAWVCALNRPSARASMYDRHRARFEDKALDVSLLSSPKLVFLAGETSHDNLDLPEDVLKELRQNLTQRLEASRKRKAQNKGWKGEENHILPHELEQVKASDKVTTSEAVSTSCVAPGSCSHPSGSRMNNSYNKTIPIFSEPSTPAATFNSTFLPEVIVSPTSPNKSSQSHGTATRPTSRSARANFKHAIKRSIDKTFQVYETSSLTGKSYHSRNLSVDQQTDAESRGRKTKIALELNRSNRSSRLPRRVLAANQIFSESGDQSAEMSSFVTSVYASPSTSGSAGNAGNTNAIPDLSVSQLQTPSRQCRVTVSTRSPDTVVSGPMDSCFDNDHGSPSKRKEKSKSQGNLFQLQIVPAAALGAELDKRATASSPSFDMLNTPPLSALVDREVFITPPVRSSENLGLKPYAPRPTTHLIPDMPTQKRVEGVYDRFLMATSGVKRLGKGYQSDNIGPVHHTPLHMPPAVASDDQPQALTVAS